MSLSLSVSLGFFSLSLFLSLCLCVSLFLSLCFSSLSFSPLLSLSLFLCLSFALSLSLFLFSLSLCVSLLSLSLCVFLFLSVSLLSLCFSPLSLSVFLSLSLSLCFSSVSLSVSLLSLCFSPLSLYLSLSLSLSPSLSHIIYICKQMMHVCVLTYTYIQVYEIHTQITCNIYIYINLTSVACHIIFLLQTSLNKSPLIEIKPFTPEEATKAFEEWFSETRTLTDSQTAMVKTAVDACRLPLFLRLTFDEVYAWTSYMPASHTVLQLTADSAIEAFFSRIEQAHGQKLVAHALGYLTLGIYSFIIGARCSSVVRAFAHRAMGRQIDPSWGGPIKLFLVPASAPRLV